MGEYVHRNSSTAPASAESIDNVYKVKEAPLGTKKHLRIVGIGAGASGLNMIRTLRKHMTDYEYVVYEKNAAVGGTWFENRYPGCKCDIPAHNYQFSWNPNPSWSSFFAPAAEIQKYLCGLCDSEDMHSAIKLEHRLVCANWNEEKGIWLLQIENIQSNSIFSDWCHFLLDASGVLNNWKWPSIPGLHEFGGDLIHSANWKDDFDYSGKTVAVIGNGSSGVQIVPALQPFVKNLVHFVRSPTWIPPPSLKTLASSKASKLLSTIEMDGEEFSSAQIEKFRANPQYYLQFVKAVEQEVNSKFPILINGSVEAMRANQGISNYMSSALNGDERLTKALIPSFPVGCRRLSPGSGYLSSLVAENSRVVTESITKVTAEGIEISTGECIKLDALICATGFDVSFCPRIPIIGREGNLQNLWKNDRPRAYMSTAVPGVPNYFMFLGPNAPIGHGSVLTITEHIAKYVTKILLKCQSEGIKAISPTHKAVNDFYEHIDTFMPMTAWSGPCKSWFKSGRANGPVTAVHPGSRIHWFHMLEQFRGEDFEYVYENQNRFWYLGNGFSIKELNGSDATWYLDKPDDLS